MVLYFFIYFVSKMETKQLKIKSIVPITFIIYYNDLSDAMDCKITLFHIVCDARSFFIMVSKTTLSLNIENNIVILIQSIWQWYFNCAFMHHCRMHIIVVLLLVSSERDWNSVRHRVSAGESKMFLKWKVLMLKSCNNCNIYLNIIKHDYLFHLR